MSSFLTCFSIVAIIPLSDSAWALASTGFIDPCGSSWGG